MARRTTSIAAAPFMDPWDIVAAMHGHRDIVGQIEGVDDLAQAMFPGEPGEARSTARAMRAVLTAKLRSLHERPEYRLPGMPRFPSWCGLCKKELICVTPKALTDPGGRAAFLAAPCGHAVYGLALDDAEIQAFLSFMFYRDNPPDCGARVAGEVRAATEELPSVHEMAAATLDWLDRVAATRDLDWDDSIRPWMASRTKEESHA